MQITGVSDSNQLLKRGQNQFGWNGADIRKLVRERCSMLHGSWMSLTGHKRPGVAGGPNAKMGLPKDEAAKKSAETSAKIAELLK